jgi:hypothetical protein
LQMLRFIANKDDRRLAKKASRQKGAKEKQKKDKPDRWFCSCSDRVSG